VAIAEGGAVRSAGRIETKPEQIKLFAQSLGKEDRVALEVTGNAWEIKRMIEPHVAEVIVVSPNDTGIRGARAKTDRLDARTLARLLAAGELESVWVPDRGSWRMRRRLQRHGQLVWARSRAKNQVHATLMRSLVGRAPFAEPFVDLPRFGGHLRSRRLPPSSPPFPRSIARSCSVRGTRASSAAGAGCVRRDKPAWRRG
jgi:transposase